MVISKIIPFILRGIKSRQLKSYVQLPIGMERGLFYKLNNSMYKIF